MADPEPGAEPNGRRDRRDRRRRRRTRNIAAIVAAVVVVIGAVVVATGLVSIGGSDHRSAADTPRIAADDPTSRTTTTVAPSKCRALTAQDPLRLWVGGDSLAGSLGPSLGSITGATGVVQPYFDSRVSSGLSNPGFFNWPNQATTELARLSPEVVVFIIGTNDFSAVNGDTWKADYAQRVEDMVKILIGDGRTVYWVSAPVLRDPKMDAAVQQVNAVAAGVVANHPEAHFVDSYKLFSGTDGKFSLTLPDETGKVVTMRAGDGIHLTVDGGNYLARAVFKLIDAQCKVTAQKVDGATKQTIETAGSTQVAPNSSGSGASVQTTPPATAAPTTTPAPATTATTPSTTAPSATTTPTSSSIPTTTSNP